MNEESLEILIKNVKPVGLMDLTNSMLALNRLYVRYLNNHQIEFDSSKPTLYIRDLKKGSIVLELGTCVTAASVALAPINTILEFTEYLKRASFYLLGRPLENIKPIMSEQEIKDISTVYETTANDASSIIQFNVNGDRNSFTFQFTGTEANAIQNGSFKEIKNLKAKDKSHVTKQLMFFYQTRFDTDSQRGNKAVIESVTEKPLSVTFKDDVLKYSFMKNHDGFSKAWQDLAYFVDAEVQTMQGQPKAYIVTKFYEDDIIDPDED